MKKINFFSFFFRKSKEFIFFCRMIYLGGIFMPKYFKLSNDGMFKLVMSDKKIMSTFLERVLNTKVNNISIVDKSSGKKLNPIKVKQYLMQEMKNNNIHVKKKTLDLLVLTDDSIIDVEYNSIFDEETAKRNYAYISSIYANTIKKFGKYKTMPNIIQINICSSIKEDYDIDNHYIKGENYKNVLVNNINIIVINIEKYKKMLYTKNEKSIKQFSHFIMFDCNKKKLEKLSIYDNYIKEVKDMLNEYNREDNMYGFLMDDESKEIFIERRINRARRDGLRLGKEQGIKKNKLETAKNMLAKNFSLQDIADVTGLKKSYLKTIKL